MEAGSPRAQVETGNLVLKTRIAVLMRNLEEVQRALDSVQQRRTDLRQILQLRVQFGKASGAITRALDSAAAAYDAGALGPDGVPTDPDSYDEVSGALGRIEAQVSSLEALLQASAEPAGRLAMPLPTDDGITPSIGSMFQTEINRRFGGLAALRSSVDKAGKATSASSDLALEGMRQAWSEYGDELYESSEQLFGEYVDLIGGLAIRDTGFDRGISRIADELIKPFGRSGDHTWDSLAIPARQEALSLAASRIIRLGFPEWTIWTLPLAAHEFGHIFANWSDEIRAYAAASQERQVCLADAFATYVVGPAYACAAILMRLDPRAAYSGEEGRLVAKRVAVILGVLDRMSTSGPRRNENFYEDITGRIETEWNDAVGQSATSDSLTQEEESAVSELIEFLDPHVLSRQLRIDEWPTIEKWATQLASGDVEDIALNGIKELRYVLNAAWRARIAVKEGEQDVDDPDSIRVIADAAEKLWNRIEEPVDEADTDARQARPRQPIRPTPPQRVGTGANR